MRASSAIQMATTQTTTQSVACTSQMWAWKTWCWVGVTMNTCIRCWSTIKALFRNRPSTSFASTLSIHGIRREITNISWSPKTRKPKNGCWHSSEWYFRIRIVDSNNFCDYSAVVTICTRNQQQCLLSRNSGPTIRVLSTNISRGSWNGEWSATSSDVFYCIYQLNIVKYFNLACVTIK